MKYYLKLDGKEQGPLTADEIVALTCKATALVRAEDSSEWTVLGSVQELTAKAEALPPLSNPMALASLVLGVVAMLLLLFILSFGNQYFRWVRPPLSGQILLAWLAASILAIISGHWAKGNIAWSVRAVKGCSTAKVGLWLWYIFGVILPVFTISDVLEGNWITEKGNITKSINNCRQIAMALKVYASDNNGHYPDFAVPDAHSSNDVFRVLFKDGVLADERIFGSPVSPFKPDGNIGTAPDFLEALKSGENHWAMTKGISDASPANIPLIFENPSEATWPPKWDASLTGQVKPGRTWSGASVVIGMNDGSVTKMKLDSRFGKSAGLKPLPDGKPVFPDLTPKPTILNVAK